MTDRATACYVGRIPRGADTELAVACDTLEGTGPELLAELGFTEIVMGPDSWQKCAAYMQQLGVPGWESVNISSFYEEERD